MITQHGDVLLNYVDPTYRCSGISKAILNSLEYHACMSGLNRCRVESTETAALFYRACGYAPSCKDPLTMEKAIKSDGSPL
ncbi:GNAT family N-acetyltransferase [uncultured Roseovarius sp.]|uniref:GNAT family N-acetyltransferase n=1 Tax=uncultured Roseovarius sp. TaxID=293344 RepID=UPI002630D26E|nr:GNAT family N-acetyltransferase [uncultured Roseovarius sp.]